LNAKWTRSDKHSVSVSPPIVSVKGILQPSL
jgi:hypothetical protein